MRDNRKESHERLIHIQKAISEIEAYSKNATKTLFINDYLLSSGILYQFSVMGEAVIHIEKHLLENISIPGIRSGHSGI
jgi:uncharacterized protein with HEPN domain